MNRFCCLLFVMLFILQCKATRKQVIKPPFSESEYRVSTKLELYCYRTVNGIDFDYPIDECEESLDSLKTGLTANGKFFVSETGQANIFIMMKLYEKENNSKLLKYANTFSLGLIPDFASIDFILELKAFDNTGKQLYEGKWKDRVEIVWHLIYLLHAPFVNPEAMSREAIIDISYQISDKIQ